MYSGPPTPGGTATRRPLCSPSAGYPQARSEKAWRDHAEHRLWRVSDKPPVAKKVPLERTHHGDTVVDEYAWLLKKDDPDTIAYLEAENAYTQEMTGHLQDLQETIFKEIKGRTLETDLSVPTRKGAWWYYSRTEEGKQYGIQCRVAADGDSPPKLEPGTSLPGEQVILDGNELAGDSPFFSMGTSAVSPDGTKLAYSTDFSGDERFTLRFKDLETGDVLPDEIPGVFYGGALVGRRLHVLLHDR